MRNGCASAFAAGASSSNNTAGGEVGRAATSESPGSKNGFQDFLRGLAVAIRRSAVVPAKLGAENGVLDLVGIGSRDDVGAEFHRFRPLRFFAQRDAGDVEVEGLFLNTARI